MKAKYAVVMACALKESATTECESYRLLKKLDDALISGKYGQKGIALTEDRPEYNGDTELRYSGLYDSFLYSTYLAYWRALIDGDLAEIKRFGDQYTEAWRLVKIEEDIHEGREPDADDGADETGDKADLKSAIFTALCVSSVTSLFVSLMVQIIKALIA